MVKGPDNVEMIPAGIYFSVVRLHTMKRQLSQCFGGMCLIWHSFTAHFSASYVYSKNKCKIPMMLPLSSSVTEVFYTYLFVWVEQKCNNTATPLKDLKLNLATAMAITSAM